MSDSRAGAVQTADGPTGWRPRADFACTSLKCKTAAGEAMVYELPVGATHCPMGHKRLVQLFNKIAVAGTRGLVEDDPDYGKFSSSSALVRTSALQQPWADHAEKSKLQDPRMRSWMPGRDPSPEHREFSRAAIAAVVGGQPGKAEPMTPIQLAEHRRLPEPRRNPVVTVLDNQLRQGHALPSLVKSS